MFEEFNMTRKLKRRLGRAISVVLSVAMLVTGLPADLLGGVASVKAVGEILSLDYHSISADSTTEIHSSKWSQGEVIRGSIFKAGKDLLEDTNSNKGMDNCTYLLKFNGAGSKTSKCVFFTATDDGTFTARLGHTNSSETRNMVFTKDGVNGEETVETWGTTNKFTEYSAEIEKGVTYYLYSTGTTYASYLEVAYDDEGGGAGGNPSEGGDLITDPKDFGTNDGLDVDPATVGNITWTFPVDDADCTDNHLTIQSKKAGYRGLEIDASTGKFDIFGNEKYVQVNEGTKVKVPVHGNCTITVNAYSGQGAGNFSIGETTATSDQLVYPYEGEKGHIEILAIAKTYFTSIKVEYADASGDETGDYIAEGTYHFGTLGTDASDPIAAINETKGLNVSGFIWNGSQHGLQTVGSATNTITLKLKDKANITLAQCQHGSSPIEKVSSTSGTVVLTDETVENGLGSVFAINGAAGETTITIDGSTQAYIHSITVEYAEPAPELDRTKAEVWDFGAMVVEGDNVINLLTADIINETVYPGIEAGKSGVSIPGSFTFKDSNGKDAVKFVTTSTNHRLRTKNAAITRYDDKELKGEDGITYQGYLYDNGGKSRDNRLEFYLYEGDTLTLMLGSNGNPGPGTYNFENPSDEIFDTFYFTNASKLEKAVFHAPEEGWYKLWCADEKLVCARIIREHAPVVEVSGSLDTTKAEKIPEGYGVLYTNKTTGAVTEMTRTDNTYAGQLYGGYDYKASLKGANGYVIKTNADLTVSKTDVNIKNDLNIESVVTQTISGKITGIDQKLLKADIFKFEIPEGYVFEPELTINEDSYTLKVEKGVTYKVTALDVNDYELLTTEISADADKADFNIAFKEKDKYAVTLTYKGIEKTDNVTVTFTNINELYTDGKTHYTYTFKQGEDIKLRDGQYSVKAAGFGDQAILQGNTMDVVVAGKEASVEIPFVSTYGNWNFAALNKTAGGVVDLETINDVSYYAGLKLNNTTTGTYVSLNKTYLLAKKDGTITIPNLEEGDKVTVKYCYLATFELGGTIYKTNTTDTATIESASYKVKAEDLQNGDFVIKATQESGYQYDKDGKGTMADVDQTYFCAIEVLKKGDMIDYGDGIIYVDGAGTGDGNDYHYNTINEALEAAKKMDREDNQRITISIEPGNYEEMFDVTVPNITLKNAAAKPSTDLTNEGVDIDPNAVRVTWYYGHGYTYYSMGSDSKYHADLLEINKANGSASYVNQGGKNNGCYWNATVTVQASGFRAEGIIFENSFNQYMSEKAKEDVIVPQGTSKDRSSLAKYSTDVQDKSYVERAAALALSGNLKEIYFENCKFVSRQDTLYGDPNTKVAFYNCSIYGGTDYIYGPMTAVFAKCDLVFNTDDQSSTDVGYVTAAQQTGQNGYLMYNCHITSTTPGVDTRAAYTSKPGYLGRPWAANTGEAVFYATIIDATDAKWFKGNDTASLIKPAGWESTLGGKSAKSVEYDTYEMAMDVSDENFGAALDNSKNRVDWAGVYKISDLEQATTDGDDESVAKAKAAYAEAVKKTSIATYLGDWNPFPEDMKVEIPKNVGTINNLPVGDVENLKLKNLGTTDGEDTARVEVTWNGLLKAAATKYEISVKEKDATTAPEPDTFTNDGEDVTISTIISGLTVGKTYEVTLTAVRVKDGVTEKGKSATETIEVKAAADPEQPEDPDEPLTGTRFDLDISKGLLKGVNYPGGFSVMIDMPLYGEKTAEDAGSLTVDGVKYDVWVQQKTTNPTNKNGKSCSSTEFNEAQLPTSGAVMILDALADGKAQFVFSTGSDKNVCIVDVGGELDAPVLNKAIVELQPFTGKPYSFKVEEGHRYYVYGTGTKLSFCAAWVQYAKEVEDPNAPVDPSERTDWKDVKAPEVVSATFDGTNKVVVKAKGDVSAKGADELVVVLKRENSATSKELSSKVQTSAEQEFTFEVSVSGTYVATAYLVRTGESRKASESTKSVNVTLDKTYERTGLHVELVKDEYIYTGTAIKPAIEVTNNGEPLTEGVDYTVKYKNNVNASVGVTNLKKLPTITVTGKGNLSGSAETNFTIVPKDIDNKDVLEDEVDDVTVADKIVIAQNTKAAPVIYYNGKKLGTKDYTLSKTDKYTTTPDEKLVITGKGNFAGTRDVEVEVVAKGDLKKLAVDVAKVNFTYDGNEHKLDLTTGEIKVYEKGDRDKRDLNEKYPDTADNYTIVYSNCKDAGTVKVTVIGNGYFTGSNVTKSYKINPIKATGGESDFDLSGKITDTNPSLDFKSTGATFDDLTVTYKANDAELVLGKDYKVSYGGNKKVSAGKAKVTISFLGNYKGSKAISKNFSIIATPLSYGLGDVLVVSSDKVYNGKPNTYVSKPYVTVNGVALKASDYTVKYYKDAGYSDEITSRNKLEVTDEFATVYVKVAGKTKGNYDPGESGEFVYTTYEVRKVDKTKDLSKARVTFTINGVKATKLEYTGNPRTFSEDDEAYDSEKNKLEVKVEIKDGKLWKTLEEGKDYETPVYVNNVNKGKATVVINGTGDYAGGKAATYSIVTRNLKLLTDLFAK